MLKRNITVFSERLKFHSLRETLYKPRMKNLIYLPILAPILNLGIITQVAKLWPSVPP